MHQKASKMVESTSQSRLIHAISFGYKCFLLFGVGLLLLAYTDVSLREQNLAKEISNFKETVEKEKVAKRQRRDAGFSFDGIFQKIQKRLDNLERRLHMFSNSFLCLSFPEFYLLYSLLKAKLENIITMVYVIVKLSSFNVKLLWSITSFHLEHTDTMFIQKN